MKWIRNHTARITLIGMIAIVICMLCAVGLLSHKSEIRSISVREIGTLYFRHIAADKKTVLWQKTAALNALAAEGESAFLDCVLRATNCSDGQR